jgi:hypothetical protein
MRMEVSQARLLSLENIARLWAAELRGTPREQSPDMLLRRMRSALFEFELSPADPTHVSKIEWYKLIRSSNVNYVTGEDVIRLDGEMNQVKISRPEFVRWAVHEKGFLPPKFWKAARPRAGSQTPNLTHRKRGRKPSKESIEAMSRLEAAVNSDPALLARLNSKSENSMSDKELAKICGRDERHHLRTARNHVLEKYAK